MVTKNALIALIAACAAMLLPLHRHPPHSTERQDQCTSMRVEPQDPAVPPYAGGTADPHTLPVISWCADDASAWPAR
ncbi:hypothetical protein [Streptomyces olivochromogenes]|uniref:hypothetical protein n=1 Tax=Streptomyces olivochromogenes TaxID=1963 RepID=UPI001F34E625|nr:hypothetical protein [Streptomyces olivochromogenes]MCF3136739.1 hypothetical protein [Streptomyces olivochromogenes]